MKDFVKAIMYGALFATPFVLLIVSSSMFFPYITGKNFYWRILVEVAVAAWVVLALYDKTCRPRLSGILMAAAALLGVMFVANLLGEYAPKSFWSNFERMEGWITLAHFFVYFVVLGSIFRTEKIWNYFLNTALVTGVIMSFYALAQIGGAINVSQGAAWRVDGLLGNSSYLGVYMLFQMFIAAWLFIKAKRPSLRWLYGVLFFLFGYILLNTGTRGTTLGLIGGSLLAFAYLAIVAEKGAAIKKWAVGGLAVVVLVAGGIWMARDTALVQNNKVLDRVAGISLAEGNIRFAIWGMALEGVKERPILGWGQENFSYVFNKYYDPAIYGAEDWYDRTHNIFMDWLIAGGVLGLLAYLSVLFMAVWYAVLRPLWARLKNGKADESNFSVYEQALLLGLLAAYTVHNLFVFDNLASWIFYAVVLAIIHSRVAKPSEAMDKLELGKEVVSKMALPIVAVAAVALVYILNVPAMTAAKDIIRAYRVTSPMDTIQVFEQALSRNSFADQEITEQLAQVGSQLIANTEANISDQDKQTAKAAVEKAMNEMIAKKPGDARLHVVYSGFYKVSGDLNKALEEMQKAEELSPNKQSIIEELGVIYMLGGKPEEAAVKFKKSYELDTSNLPARVRYAAAELMAGNEEEFRRILPTSELAEGMPLWSALVQDPLMINVAHQLKRYDILEMITEGRITMNPKDTDLRVNLAALYFEQGDKEKATAVLREAIKDIPEFKTEGEALIKQINNG